MALEEKNLKKMPVSVEVNHVSFKPWHRHVDEIEIMMVLEGTAEITLSCSDFSVNKHEIAVMNRSTFHNVSSSPKCLIVSIYFDVNYFEKFFKYLRSEVYIVEPHKMSLEQKYELEQVKNLILKISSEAMEQDNKKAETVNENIMNLSMELLDNLTFNFNEVRYYNPRLKPSSVKAERYYFMRKYVNENYHKKTLLEEMSGKEFFCKSYLSHVFRDVSTFGLKEIISFNRNWNSEEMLLLTEKSINQISDDCGYSDPKYYYRYFKKWYKCTPFAYRRKYKKEMKMKAAYEKVNEADASKIINKLLNNYEEKRCKKNSIKVISGDGEKEFCEIEYSINYQGFKLNEHIDEFLNHLKKEHPEIKIMKK